MIINREYIIDRLNEIASEKLKSQQHSKNKADKLFDIKQRFPKWMRSALFHPFNPAYSIYLQYKLKKAKNNDIIQIPLHPFAVEFLKYCMTHDLNFNTSEYYPKEDLPNLVSYIDNRIESILHGSYKTFSHPDLGKVLDEKKKISASISRKNGGYTFAKDGNNYWLPSSSFSEHTYIHDYGLKYLPQYVSEYITGKELLDVGAFIGDTTIMLAKKYKPSRIVAYEPVKENASNLSQTLVKNDLNNVEIIEKGMGDKEEDIEIFVNLNELSSCSLNSSFVGDNTTKSTIRITTIDKECQDRKVGLIKMDIEGSEYSAIMGGLNTIKRDKPVLVISLYHTAKDFFEIPPLLKNAVPDYLFRFIDLDLANSICEKVLIAYPPKDAL